MQGIEKLGGDAPLPENLHPIEIFARAYGITV